METFKEKVINQSFSVDILRYSINTQGAKITIPLTIKFGKEGEITARRYSAPYLENKSI